METKGTRVMKTGIVSLMIMSLCYIHPATLSAQTESQGSDTSPEFLKKYETEDNNKATPITETPITISEEKKVRPPKQAVEKTKTEPRVVVSNSDDDGKTWLYVGVATAGVVGIAAALASSSGSSDTEESTTTTTTSTTQKKVGPDIEGSDWTGTLDIRRSGYEGKQAITATITHRGSAVTIRTSSTLHHGKHFKGKISSSGYIKVYDTSGGKTWTTHFGRASSSSIRLYDAVNDETSHDRLRLSR